MIITTLISYHTDISWNVCSVESIDWLMQDMLGEDHMEQPYGEACGSIMVF